MLIGCVRICTAKLPELKNAYLVWKNVAARNNYFRTTKLLSENLVLKTREYYIPIRKLGEHSISRLEIWRVLKWLGVNQCKMVVFRRRMKRFTYPWFAYSIPAALILGLGDVIAQYFLAPHPQDRTVSEFFTRDWEKERTLVYVLMGLFLVGPVVSYWDLFWYRRLRCKSRMKYLLAKILLDVLILSPILVSLMAVIFDQRHDNNIFTDSPERTMKCFRCKLKPAILDVLQFNLLTRPLMMLALCYLVPPHFRRLFRGAYEVMFATYLSDSFLRHYIRCRPKPPPPPPPPPVEPLKPEPKKSSLGRAWKWPC